MTSKGLLQLLTYESVQTAGCQKHFKEIKYPTLQLLKSELQKRKALTIFNKVVAKKKIIQQGFFIVGTLAPLAYKTNLHQYIFSISKYLLTYFVCLKLISKCAPQLTFPFVITRKDCKQKYNLRQLHFFFLKTLFLENSSSRVSLSFIFFFCIC